MTMTDFVVMADLVALTKATEKRLNYAMKLHGPPPVGRIGVNRIWSRAQLDDIRESLRKCREANTRLKGQLVSA
jgi:hypothetical protein